MVAVAVEATKATSPLNRKEANKAANKAVRKTVCSIIVSPLRLLNRLMAPNRMEAVVAVVVADVAVVDVEAVAVAAVVVAAVAAVMANTQWSPR